MSGPVRVDDVTSYWSSPPPAQSARCSWWMQRIADGWRPNRRVSGMGYHERAEFHGVYIWEYVNVIAPALAALEC